MTEIDNISKSLLTAGGWHTSEAYSRAISASEVFANHDFKLAAYVSILFVEMRRYYIANFIAWAN